VFVDTHLFGSQKVRSLTSLADGKNGLVLHTSCKYQQNAMVIWLLLKYITIIKPWPYSPFSAVGLNLAPNKALWFGSHSRLSEVQIAIYVTISTYHQCNYAHVISVACPGMAELLANCARYVSSTASSLGCSLGMLPGRPCVTHYAA
jgi:hypothetical protein